MPRYYKDKIYTEEERQRIAFFAKMQNEVLDEEKEKLMIEEYGDEWPRIKLEQHIFSFQKMYKNALKDRNKIT